MVDGFEVTEVAVDLVAEFAALEAGTTRVDADDYISGASKSGGPGEALAVADFL